MVASVSKSLRARQLSGSPPVTSRPASRIIHSVTARLGLRIAHLKSEGAYSALQAADLRQRLRCSSSKHHKVHMKKTFKLNVEGKHPDRVLEAIKHEIRKYVKRQRRVPLPAGVDFWDFDCRFGATEATATEVHFSTLTALMDAAAKEKGEQFYVEVLHKEGRRLEKPEGADQALAEPLSTRPATLGQTAGT